MNTRRPWLALSVLVAGISWLYATRVLEPWNQRRGEAADGIQHQMGDLYSPYVGAHELLLHRRNPYGPQVSDEIQAAFYGRAINPGDTAPSGRVINEQRFAYPVYTVFILSPAVLMDFTQVRRAALFVLALLIAITVLFCLDILHWRLPCATAAALILFTLSSPQIVQGIRFQQMALLVAFLIVAGAWCAGRGYFVLSGMLLALSTIKPQMALLPLCWFVIWTVGDWRKRWRLAAAFCGTLLALVAAGEALLPGWIGYFLSGVSAYRKYAPTTSLLRVVLGDTLGMILGGFLVLGVLLLAWRDRHDTADSPRFHTTFAFFLMAAILAFPLFTPYNQALLIFPVLMLLKEWTALPRFSRLVFAVIVSWPWIVCFLLLFFRPRPDSSSQLVLLPSFLVLFFPLFLPLLLRTSRRSDPIAETSD